MNWGRIATIGLALTALASGAGVWYAQQYGYYEPIDPASPACMTLRREIPSQKSENMRTIICSLSLGHYAK